MFFRVWCDLDPQMHVIACGYTFHVDGEPVTTWYDPNVGPFDLPSDAMDRIRAELIRFHGVPERLFE